METITKTFNIYAFDELPHDIKKKVIEREEEGIREADIDFLGEEMKFYAQQLLEENFGDKATYINVCYSLSYCQGDGAMIEFDLNYCGKNVEIRHNSFCNYYHENSFKIVEVDFDDELTHKQYQTLKEKIININKQLTKHGYAFIEEDRTEQAIEQLKDCMFYENGDLYESSSTY